MDTPSFLFASYNIVDGITLKNIDTSEMKEVNNFHLYHWVRKEYYYSLNLHETQTPCSPFFLVVVLFLTAPMRSSSEL